MLYKDPKKDLNKEYRVLATYTGKELEGLEYEPLFNYFRSTFEGVGFKVLTDTYVTDEDGTGVVHQAPAFGEDDYRVARKFEIITEDRPPPCPVDERGIYTAEVTDFVGQYVKVGCLSRRFSMLGRGQAYSESIEAQWSLDHPVSIHPFIPFLLAVITSSLPY